VREVQVKQGIEELFANVVKEQVAKEEVKLAIEQVFDSVVEQKTGNVIN